MCTSGSADSLIVATSLGSLILYDLKNIIDSNPTLNKMLNYKGLLEASIKDWDQFEMDKKQAYMNNATQKFSILNHSFICDGLNNYPHFSPIKKLSFISRSSSGISQIGCLDE
jgi:hypothetical protein